MKPKLILKSLADIPADAVSLAASMPGRAMNVSKLMLGPAMRATRREISSARLNSAALARDIFSRVSAPFRNTSWQHGGINE